MNPVRNASTLRSKHLIDIDHHLTKGGRRQRIKFAVGRSVFIRLWVQLSMMAAALLFAAAEASAQPVNFNAQMQYLGQLINDSRFDEALQLAQRLVIEAERQFGPEHPNYARMLDNLGQVYLFMGRYGDALEPRVRALSIAESAFGPNHPEVATRAYNLGAIYYSLGRYREAEALNRRALAIREKALGMQHPDTAWVVNNLASVYYQQERYTDAEKAYNRALAIWEKSLGPQHSSVATALRNLAIMLGHQGRFDEEEKLLRRALSIRRNTADQDGTAVASLLNNLGHMYEDQGLLQQAEDHFLEAYAIDKKILGSEHPAVVSDANYVALAHHAHGRLEEADKVYQETLAHLERTLGKEAASVAWTLNNLALLRQAQGRFDEAAKLFARALSIREQTDGAKSLEVAEAHRNLGLLASTRGRWAEAHAAFARAVAVEARRLFSGEPVQYTRRAVETRRSFIDLSEAAWRLAIDQPAKRNELSNEAFENAQLATRSAAGIALSQMAARFAADANELGGLVRDLQDLSVMRSELEKRLIEAITSKSEKRNETMIASLRNDLQRTEDRQSRLKIAIEKSFPDFAELSNPKPVDLAELQRQLGSEEVLITYFVAAEYTFVWAVNREGWMWERIALGAAGIAEKVAALRKGLDVDDLVAGAKAGKVELFDLGGAHALYDVLIKPVSESIKGKSHVIIVPSGALTSLPFQLLVTEKPVVAQPRYQDLVYYREAAWFIKRQALTVLPSVSSLKSLRGLGSAATGKKSLVGYGDPVFKSIPRKAASSQRPERIANTGKPRAYVRYFRGARADLASLGEDLAALPETARELRLVGQRLGASPSDIHLGDAATEEAVKKADLSSYRIVYFATHGLVGGEVQGLAEPALALTLPKQPSDVDDGLLTASEVAKLKLNAEWVVLSACNTAAGDKPGAEALSGLARAFFYAGARALMVSHWRVDSEAAVRLTTSTFEALQNDPSIGRAEALRRSMLVYLNDTSNPWNAYPDFWGPFSVVGEGAR